MTRKIDEIDALKGFAMFLIVLGHSIIVFPINLLEINFWCYLFKFIRTFHLPLFFIVSGFCYSYKNNYKEYIIKKIKRILVPYLVFSFINVIMRCALPTLANRTGEFISMFIDIFTKGGEYWFLYTLLVIFLIYPLLNKLNDNKYLGIIFESILIVISVFELTINIFCFTSMFKYLIYFNTGVLIKKYYSNIFNIKNNYLYLIISFILLVISFVLYMNLENDIFEFICGVLGIIFSFYLVKIKQISNLFKPFGNYSLQLHLLNGYFLVISRTLICRMTNIPFIIVLFNLIIDYVVSYYVIKFVCGKSKVIRTLMGIN